MNLINKLVAVSMTLMAILSATPQDTDFSQKDKPATIKVLLMRKAPDVVLEVKGRFFVFNPLDGTRLTSGIMSKRDMLKCEEYGLNWGEKFPGIYQIRVLPGDSQSTILVNGTEYRGCIEVYAVDGVLSVVNEVDVETYLKTTLAAEAPDNLDDEVLSSLAIAMRTNAYYLATKSKYTFWHVDADESHYSGVSLELGRPDIEKAVSTTRHAVMTYENGPFATTWSANSAGRTVDFATIFRKAITTPPGVIAGPASKERLHHKWSFTLPKQALAKMTNLPSISKVDLYVAHNSEKVYGVKVSNGGASNDIDFVTLQKVLTPQKLKSNDFTVAVKGDELVFTGYGEGPSVGLCLFSASAMAEKGEKAQKILSTFYPGTQIEKVKTLDSFR
jgi:SpoIID/LytB domain protein